MGIGFGRLAEKMVAKVITALPEYAGTEKAMALAAKAGFDRFIWDKA